MAVVELVTESVSGCCGGGGGSCWFAVAIFKGSILEPLNQRLLDSKHVLSDGVKGLVIWKWCAFVCWKQREKKKQRMHEKENSFELCKLRMMIIIIVPF